MLPESRAALSQNDIAVICSARSGRSKAEGTTNQWVIIYWEESLQYLFEWKSKVLRWCNERLLKASREAAKADSTLYRSIVSDILQWHLDIPPLKDPKIQGQLTRDIKLHCEDLLLFLESLPKTGTVTAEDEDKIIGVGERLSAQYLTALLQDLGIQSEYLDLSTVISIGETQEPSQTLYREVSQRIRERIELCGDKVPVWYLSSFA